MTVSSSPRGEHAGTVDPFAPIRHTVDTLTSDALDALYDRLEAAEREADATAAAAAHLTTLVGKRAERAEQAVERVREVCADPNHSNMILTRNVLAALADPKEI